jgi:hypothetical protein
MITWKTESTFGYIILIQDCFVAGHLNEIRQTLRNMPCNISVPENEVWELMKQQD